MAEQQSEYAVALLHAKCFLWGYRQTSRPAMKPDIPNSFPPRSHTAGLALSPLCPRFGGTGLTFLPGCLCGAFSCVSVNPLHLHSLTPVLPERFLFAARGAWSPELGLPPLPADPADPAGGSPVGPGSRTSGRHCAAQWGPPSAHRRGGDTLRQSTCESCSTSSRGLEGKGQGVAFQASLATERGFLRRLEKLAMSSLYRRGDCARITFIFSQLSLHRGINTDRSGALGASNSACAQTFWSTALDTHSSWDGAPGASPRSPCFLEVQYFLFFP